MSFADLHDFCQEQPIHVNRNVVRAKIYELAGIDRIAYMRTSLDTTKCRGFYVSPQNKDHPIVKQFGCHVVVSARDLNRCWERFVVVKEMMHVFRKFHQMIFQRR